LFNGLLSAPATRKREGVVSLLTAFPESRFLLVGDTGEQDLELYAAMARDYPEQILGVFVRDAGRGGGGLVEDVGPLEDPTGAMWGSLLDFGPPGNGVAEDRDGGNSPVAGAASRMTPSRTPTTFFTSNDRRPPPPRSSTQSEPPLDLRRRTLPDAELSNDASLMAVLSMRGEQFVRRRGSADVVGKKRAELQVRVWKARAIMPDPIPLRVFQQPHECTEVKEILE
jgi:hypothetical protein